MDAQVRRRRGVKVLAITALSLCLGGRAFGGTKIVHSWRDPSAGPLQFKKVLVISFAPYQSQQLFAESELVRLMKRTHGVAAHSLLTADEAKDPQKVRGLMEREGFDGAITLRYLHTEQDFSNTGGYIPTGQDFWGHYVDASSDYAMGYVKVDRRLKMETQIFSMKDNKLIWSGISDTKNPDSAQEVVEGVAAAVIKALKKQRLLQ